MAAPVMSLEVLPASFGDCLLLTCHTPSGPWRLLVDTGPDETYSALQAHLRSLMPNAQGKRVVDTFVVSHIDHDHIGGAALLLNDDSLDLEFGDIWFNAPTPAGPRTRGVAEGQRLAEILGATSRALPWNVATEGQWLRSSPKQRCPSIDPRRGLKLTVVSPSLMKLKALFAQWDKELAKMRAKTREAVEPARLPRGVLLLEDLAASETATDKALPNGSSIALLVEYKKKSALLAADAHPDVLVEELRALADSRQVKLPWNVDVFKLPHHGSRANVTTELLKVVRARHYVVSTNNAQFGHPDSEALARVICTGGRPTIWFNYTTKQNLSWNDPERRAQYRYACRYPSAPGGGVRLEL
ncbi:MAG: ComEC/Rec2 family competence protein [Piscinibacter sp.]|uniref:ComEC/Rec2 family competence protein n=1 Tax=Piscinibacter sp. TaxID=1903157 RepID=UPI003D13C304